jgi:hypothetical protein
MIGFFVYDSEEEEKDLALLPLFATLLFPDGK